MIIERFRSQSFFRRKEIRLCYGGQTLEIFAFGLRHIMCTIAFNVMVMIDLKKVQGVHIGGDSPRREQKIYHRRKSSVNAPGRKVVSLAYIFSYMVACHGAPEGSSTTSFSHLVL